MNHCYSAKTTCHILSFYGTSLSLIFAHSSFPEQHRNNLDVITLLSPNQMLPDLMIHNPKLMNPIKPSESNIGSGTNGSYRAFLIQIRHSIGIPDGPQTCSWI